MTETFTRPLRGRSETSATDYILPDSPEPTMQPTSPTCEKETYLLSHKEACEFLRVSRNTLLRWVAQGQLPVYRLCRKLHYKREDLIAFIDSKRIAARNDARYQRTTSSSSGTSRR